MAFKIQILKKYMKRMVLLKYPKISLDADLKIVKSSK